MGELREKEQRESPSFPFPNYYRDFAGRGSGTPKSPLLSPSDPAAGRCGGEDVPGGLGIPAALELIPQSRAACHAFLVCFVCFCFNRTDGIIFSRAHALHETFQNSPRRSQWSVGGGCWGVERGGGSRSFSVVQELCNSYEKKGIKTKTKHKCTGTSSLVTQQKDPLVEIEGSL